LKWRVVDARGRPVVLAAAGLTVSSRSCTAGATDAIEEYSSGTSGLQSLGDGSYQLNWLTKKAFKGSCKVIALSIGDGVEHTALFRFR
jgi:hypothetical protein